MTDVFYGFLLATPTMCLISAVLSDIFPRTKLWLIPFVVDAALFIFLGAFVELRK